MSKKLAEKFLNNQTTPAESKAVLEWFETSKGKQFLQERIEAEKGLMERKDLHGAIPELDSEKLYNSIQEEIKKKQKSYSLRKTDWIGYLVKAAAAILVILTAAMFTISHEWSTVEQITEKAPVIFQTNEEQHREIKLSDGSTVRLNKNSEIVILEDFMKDRREIKLTGEAFFDVAHNSEKPFIIQTGNSSIEVLGTSFNVRSVSGQKNIQVAVVEGSVAFKNIIGDMERPEVVLTGGQYGYMDIEESSIIVEEIAINNYMAWKSGRFVFEDLKLSQVCDQLNRLYYMKCAFMDDRLKDIPLTANFSNESKEKTLSVIALTLDIDFEIQKNMVYWKN